MGLEGMYRGWRKRIRKRDAELQKQGTTAGQEQVKVNRNLSKLQKWDALSSSQQWAVQNPDLAAYDHDGNPIDDPMKHWGEFDDPNKP